MPGIFNEDNSMIIFSPPLKVKNYKTENITKHIQYDYIVQNDARANAFADYWYSHKNENTVRDELEEKLYLMVILFIYIVVRRLMDLLQIKKFCLMSLILWIR
jgi:hypothetical protein